MIDIPSLTNGGVLIPLLIAAGCWLAWRLTTEESDEGDR